MSKSFSSAAGCQLHKINGRCRKPNHRHESSFCSTFPRTNARARRGARAARRNSGKTARAFFLLQRDETTFPQFFAALGTFGIAADEVDQQVLGLGRGGHGWAHDFSLTGLRRNDFGSIGLRQNDFEVRRL